MIDLLVEVPLNLRLLILLTIEVSFLSYILLRKRNDLWLLYFRMTS